MKDIHVTVKTMDDQTPNRSSSWREPVQLRSRERVRQLLEAARELIIESGHMDLKMTQIAERASVPVGSLYQFFPTRTALLSRLFEIEMSVIDNALRNSLNRAKSLEDLIKGVELMMNASLVLIRQRPCLFAIWSCPATDPVIQAADLANTRNNALLLTEKFMSLAGSQTQQSEVHAAAMLICHLWGSVARLCFLLENEGNNKLILSQYVSMIQDHLRKL